MEKIRIKDGKTDVVYIFNPHGAEGGPYLDREFSFTLRSMFWEQDNLVSMKLPVESMWTADLQSQKAFTLTPVLNVYYVYPVYDRKVQPY